MRYKIRLGVVLTSLAFVHGGYPLAAEVPAGTVISKANLDSLKNETFEGKPIGSMIPEKMEMQIRDYGMTIDLRSSEPIGLDPRMIEATKKYSGEVKYDPATNEVTGYKAGVPFPDANPDDPNYAEKLVWNFYYASPVGQVMDFRRWTYLLVDQDKGVERRQHWYFLRYFMKNRLTGENVPVDGDGTEFSRTLLFAIYPQDIRGLGTFTIRYDSPQVEDSWVYIKSARRTRRLPGGAWMDPIGGTDQLNDDLEIWNARPSWYRGFKYLGKRWVLAVTHGRVAWDESKKGTPEEYPAIDTQNPPHWNPKDGYEPREVHVIETIPPEEHPYSRKIIYMDTETLRIYYGEAYDRKGDFWKWLQFNARPVKGEDGTMTIATTQGHTIDFKRRHATIFLSHPSWKTNTPIKASDVTLGKLEAAGQ